MKWRWDQGRLEYFQFDEIQKVAKALSSVDGIELPRASEVDTLRVALGQFSTSPFHPARYTVWRNYKRVFGCQMLATEIGGLLICTELCKLLATGSLTQDAFFLHLVRRFYYPAPVFQGYDSAAEKIFALSAALKMLFANFIFRGIPVLSLDDVALYVGERGFHGREGLEDYAVLTPARRASPVAGDERRQMRELFIFLSQVSFLKWDQGNLLLDIDSAAEARDLAAHLQPEESPHDPNGARELIRLGGSVAHTTAIVLGRAIEQRLPDTEVIEGMRSLVTHVRIERSTRLKDIFFRYKQSPHTCDMCTMNTLSRYPWTVRLIELHHLLPLSSGVRFERRSTSLKDIVGLCPSCHRATHRFYSRWLQELNLQDFRNADEAAEVYRLARQRCVI